VTGERLRVLDTSVVVPWFFLDEPNRASALELRGVLLREPSHFVVPPLFHAELVHVVARKSGRDRLFVVHCLELFLRLGLRTVALSERALLRTAHWACTGLSGYDATFVSLAEDLGGVWTTNDKKAAKLAGVNAELLTRD